MKLSPQQVARWELNRRKAASTSLLGFTSYTFPRYRIAAHHARIAAKLEAVERGEITRLMIFMPPRHGKSELASKRFPAWFMGRNPSAQFISASYNSDLSADFGRSVRNIIASPEFGAVFSSVSLAADSRAQDRWNTAQGGSYVAAGVGTAVTGRGADILSIDDPVKDRAEAESQAMRDRAWNWYTSTAYTRLMPGGRVVLTQTRWHEDDLAGRLLAEQAAGGDQWDVLSLPAIDDEGDALWPDAYPIETLERIRSAVGQRDWAALYQQSPRPFSGGVFKVEQVGCLDAAPASLRPVRAWDLAATAATGTRNPDWTVGVQLGRTASGGFIVPDIVRLRGGPEETEAAILATAERDGRGVRICLPQDPGQAGKAQIAYLTKKLAGYTVLSSPETGDKATRAMPVASQCNVGNLSIVRGAWNRDFLDELAVFPSGAKDDQVDALSRAFSVVGLAAAPLRFSPELLARI